MGIDIEQLYWSPFNDETVYFDVFDRYSMSLAHSGPVWLRVVTVREVGERFLKALVVWKSLRRSLTSCTSSWRRYGLPWLHAIGSSLRSVTSSEPPSSP